MFPTTFKRIKENEKIEDEDQIDKPLLQKSQDAIYTSTANKQLNQKHLILVCFFLKVNFSQNVKSYHEYCMQTKLPTRNFVVKLCFI